MKKNLRFMRRSKQAATVLCGVALSWSQMASASVWTSPRPMEYLHELTLNQQTGTLAGTVTDAEGLPLIGASVKVVGSNQTVATDNDGRYRLQLAPGTYTIEVSYISFQTKQQSGVVVREGGSTTTDFVLEDGIGELNEVVVVGYGQNVRRNLTTAVSSVKPEDIPDRNVASANQLLQGQVAGVNLTTSNGTPGGNSRVSIRGVSSINGDNEPLYVIDGIPLSKASASYNFSGEYRQDPLSMINPSDIETIDVLKDAAATAIYGSRGTNGVIMITTKQGKKGAPKVSFNQQ